MHHGNQTHHGPPGTEEYNSYSSANTELKYKFYCGNLCTFHTGLRAYILFLEVLQRSIPYRFLAMNILDRAGISHEVRRYPTIPTTRLAHKSEKCTPNIYIIYVCMHCPINFHSMLRPVTCKIIFVYVLPKNI